MCAQPEGYFISIFPSFGFDIDSLTEHEINFGLFILVHAESLDHGDSFFDFRDFAVHGLETSHELTFDEFEFVVLLVESG